MWILTSGGQLVKRECLEHPTVNTSCTAPEVITVKVEADYINVVNTVLYTNPIYIKPDTANGTKSWTVFILKFAPSVFAEHSSRSDLLMQWSQQWKMFCISKTVPVSLTEKWEWPWRSTHHAFGSEQQPAWRCQPRRTGPWRYIEKGNKTKTIYMWPNCPDRHWTAPGLWRILFYGPCENI